MPRLISRESVDRVFQETDIVQVVQRACPDLKKSGSNYMCKSPWTGEKTASLSVSPSKQIFKDFSSGKGGNAVKFIMEFYNKTFPEAIEHLAQDFNIILEYDDTERGQHFAKQKEEKEQLRSILKDAQGLFSNALKSLPKDHPAWQEITRRGYNDETILEYGIGYAPGNDFLFNHFAAKQQLNQARQLGLIGEKADKYFRRVVYPLRDVSGLICGFAGRDITGNSPAKWINPKENILFNKSKYLYGLDIARLKATNSGSVFLVEGYNDAISLQLAGIINTAAINGTALTDKHIHLLKRLKATNVYLFLDPDKAGVNAAIKIVPQLLKSNFGVKIIQVNDQDPDDFVREHGYKMGAEKLLSFLLDQENCRDGFGFLIDNYLSSDDVANKAAGLKELTKVLAGMKDLTMKDIYSDWLAKESKRNRSLINKLIKEHETVVVEMTSVDEEYTLPKQLEGKVKLQDHLEDIRAYQMFMAGNRIWMQRGSEPPYHFKSVSNCSVSIIQHMNDEKFPSKLIKMTNVFGATKIFDVLSDKIITPDSFRKVLAGHGNFYYNGSPIDHDRLLPFLFDKMGDGDKVDVLGWHNEGFFVFNNLVVMPNEPNKAIDENGVFVVDKNGRQKSFYVPSANTIYKTSRYKYEAQKKVVVKGSPDLTFNKYAHKMIQVHRGHGITGILFSLASMFQDLIVEEAKGFPIVFLYGPPSTGKDQLVESCQSFFGKPQTGINLEGGASTAKAQLRELAQFSNLISHLSEYQRGDKKLDGILKGMWDRRGYKRGTLESHVSTESIPVLSSVFLTGNDYPDQDALITRLIWEEMTKKEFTKEEVDQYTELKDLSTCGVSHLTVEIIKHRSMFEQQFRSQYRQAYNDLNGEFADTKAHSRIINNLSVLATTYRILRPVLTFPFSWEDIIAHFRKVIENQMRKLKSASTAHKWWDVFLAVCRTRQEPLRHNVDFRIVDDLLYFNFTNTYNRIAPQWYKQYSEVAPGKSKIMDMLKDDDLSGFQTVRSFRFGGTDGSRTSAHCVKVSSLPIAGEIHEMIHWQQSENLDRLGPNDQPSAKQIPDNYLDKDQDDNPIF